MKKISIPVFPEYVEILGSPWKIETHSYDKDSYFKKHSCDGYCSEPDQIIVVCDMTTHPCFDLSSHTEEYICNEMKRILRHEIVHAFFSESGLSDSSEIYTNGWAINEEMVDWIARQGQKIYKVWHDANALTPMMPERYLNWKVAAKNDGTLE